MKALARVVARDPLPVKLNDGSSPVVVALPEDPITDVTERVARVGGAANVVVADTESFAIVAFVSRENNDPIGEAVEVHHLSDAGMLVAWLSSTPDNCGSFRVKGQDTEPIESLPAIQEHEYAF